MFDVGVSMDTSGQLLYWGGPKQDYNMPKCLRFESTMETDLITYLMVTIIIAYVIIPFQYYYINQAILFIIDFLFQLNILYLYYLSIYFNFNHAY